MANVFIDENILQGWADTVREKTGTTDKMLPAALLQQTQDNWGTGGGGGAVGDATVKYVTFLNEDGTTLYQMPVLVGDDCKDPITHGDISTPTKESTNTQVFTYSGWTSTVGGTADSSILKNITEDKTVYVAYAVSTRYYTVNFYANDALFETVQVPYGGTATPSTIPTKDGYSFDSWEPSPTNVTEDMDCYAVWVEGVKFATASWAKIAEISEAGEAEKYFKIKDKKTIILTRTDGTTLTYTAKIIGFNHDALADGSGFAGITCQIDTGYPPTNAEVSSTLATSIWSKSPYRTALNGTVLSYLESDLLQVIKPVNKSHYADTDYETTTDTLWLISTAELGYVNHPQEGTVYPVYNSGATKDYTQSTAHSDVDGQLTRTYNRGYDMIGFVGGMPRHVSKCTGYLLRFCFCI